jgi:hypothetical protein
MPGFMPGITISGLHASLSMAGTKSGHDESAFNAGEIDAYQG